VQIVRAGQVQLVRLPVLVQQFWAQVTPAAVANGRATLQLQMFRGTTADTRAPIPWGPVATSAEEQPTVALLHQGLDWFGIVPVASVSSPVALDTTATMRGALPSTGRYHALTSFTLKATGGNTAGRGSYTSEVVTIAAGAQTEPEVQATQVPPEPFPASVVVRPFEAEQLDKSIAAGEAPVFRLSEIEAAAHNGFEGTAVAVELSINGGYAVRAGECTLMRLSYTYANSSMRGSGKVRTF
jgi:hypothetical protein